MLPSTVGIPIVTFGESQILSIKIKTSAKTLKQDVNSPPNAEQSHVYHLFVIRCAERDRLAHFLGEHGIETLIHYPVPVHRQRCCKNARCDSRGLSAAASYAEQCLSLPCHPQLHDDDVTKITATINQFE